MEDEDEKIQIAAVRVLKVLTQAVTPESACYRLACDAAKKIDPKTITLLFLQYRIFTNLRLDTSRQREVLYGHDVVSDIFLENLKSATPWILKSVNIKLLADQVDHENESICSISVPTSRTSSRSVSRSESATMRDVHSCAWPTF